MNIKVVLFQGRFTFSLADFPVDCHEAKFKYKMKQNESVFIDVDGPEGPLHPIPVYCQMTEEYHVGITIISHKQ